MPPTGAARGARNGAGPGPDPGTSAAAAAAAAAATGNSGLGGRRTGGALIARPGAPMAAEPRSRKVLLLPSRELLSSRLEAENKNFPEKSPRRGGGRGDEDREGRGEGKMAEAGGLRCRQRGRRVGEAPPRRGAAAAARAEGRGGGSARPGRREGAGKGARGAGKGSWGRALRSHHPAGAVAARAAAARPQWPQGDRSPPPPPEFPGA